MEFIETIKIKNGKIYNLFWHNWRFNKTRFDFFGLPSIYLEEYIKDFPKRGLFRCRVLYNQEILNIEYIPYTPKIFKTFKILSSDIDYSYKYNNREELNSLKEQNSLYSDIIIQKNGLLTDTTIANIAFFDGEQWITPKEPLLRGTIREKLLNKKMLFKKNIKSEDLRHFHNFALMNAMIGFQIQKNITIYINTKEKICL